MGWKYRFHFSIRYFKHHKFLFCFMKRWIRCLDSVTTPYTHTTRHLSHVNPSSCGTILGHQPIKRFFDFCVKHTTNLEKKTSRKSSLCHKLANFAGPPDDCFGSFNKLLAENEDLHSGKSKIDRYY